MASEDRAPYEAYLLNRKAYRQCLEQCWNEPYRREDGSWAVAAQDGCSWWWNQSSREAALQGQATSIAVAMDEFARRRDPATSEDILALYDRLEDAQAECAEHRRHVATVMQREAALKEEVRRLWGEPMRVWTVEREDWDLRHIAGYYATEELAKAACERAIDRWGYGYFVEEHEVERGQHGE